jgi:hypothetical protein
MRFPIKAAGIAGLFWMKGISWQFMVYLLEATMHAFVITSQTYPEMHWQATPKKAATELGTADVPQATQVLVKSFQIELGEDVVEQLHVRLLIVAPVGQAKHLKLDVMMLPTGQTQAMPFQEKEESMHPQAVAFSLLEA